MYVAFKLLSCSEITFFFPVHQASRQTQFIFDTLFNVFLGLRSLSDQIRSLNMSRPKKVCCKPLCDSPLFGPASTTALRKFGSPLFLARPQIDKLREILAQTPECLSGSKTTPLSLDPSESVLGDSFLCPEDDNIFR